MWFWAAVGGARDEATMGEINKIKAKSTAHGKRYTSFMHWIDYRYRYSYR